MTKDDWAITVIQFFLALGTVAGLNWLFGQFGVAPAVSAIHAAIWFTCGGISARLARTLP